MSAYEAFLRQRYDDAGALFGPGGLHRYRLWRTWGDETNRVVFVGVNPSTAGATSDDATIRKCVGFAKRWGFGAMDMVNLFAWVDTDQRGLVAAHEPIGVENDCRIMQAFDGASRIVLAWGAGKTASVRKLITARIQAEARMLYGYRPVQRGTFGETADGFAKHPLMLGYATAFVPLEAKS